MKQFNKECGATSALAIYLLMAGISCFFLGIFLSEKFLKSFKRLLNLKNKTSSLQKDVIEMKKTTCQIANDWKEMTKLIAEIQDYQAYFVECLQSEFQAKCETLGQKINDFLKREISRNDGKLEEMKESIEIMRQDILSTKICLVALAPRSDQVLDGSVAKKGSAALVTNNTSQTVGEIKKRIKDGRTKSSTYPDHEISKLTTLVKKCLADLMKEVTHQLSVDREDENRELQIIFKKLAEDRKDIKTTIVQAFAVAADQAKRSIDQFGVTGQEAMGLVAVLSEDTNKMLNTKLGNANDRLKEILNTVKRQNYDVVSIRETLENIDGQFDEIFKRIELGCQRNTDQCEEMTENLEKTSRNWQVTALELEKASREFSNDSRKMKEMLKEIKSLVDSVYQRDLFTIPEKTKGRHKITQYESSGFTATQDLRMNSHKQKTMLYMYSMIQSFWDKMSGMNNRLESECEDIYKLIETLRGKLLSLNESAAKLDDAFRNIDVANLARHLSCSKCQDENSEEILERMLRCLRENAGDAQSSIFRQIDGKQDDELLAKKVQNVSSLEKELNIIEHILRKVFERRNICKKSKEILINLQDSAVAKERYPGSLMEMEHVDEGEKQQLSEKNDRKR